MSCRNNENESINKVVTKFAAERHDPNLDQQIQPLLNQYFAVMDHLQVQDSADLLLYGSNMVLLADSLVQKKIATDTATQNRAEQGLINIQYEMTAILMESSPEERILGAQMLSLQWIDFLAAIGYQKQTIYIFTDKDESRWIGLKNKECNPYKNEGDVKYNALQVLQELR
jgi:hypothetical protein